tara:strand:- start:382 stop:585 length:204 start_codon:yes stop_codon:yes gene_type:complete
MNNKNGFALTARSWFLIGLASSMTTLIYALWRNSGVIDFIPALAIVNVMAIAKVYSDLKIAKGSITS